MVRIAQARKARGWTQEQLANHVGTTQQTIQRWESGITEPKLSDIKKISRTLGITLSYILGIDEHIESDELNDDEREILAFYRKLSAASRHAILAGIRDYSAFC